MIDPSKIYMKSIEDLVPFNKMARHNLDLERYKEVEQAASNIVGDYMIESSR